MFIIIYKYSDGSGEEVFGPFESEQQRDRWIDFRQNHWQAKKRWTGQFILDELRSPFEKEETDPRILLMGRLGL